MHVSSFISWSWQVKEHIHWTLELGSLHQNSGALPSCWCMKVTDFGILKQDSASGCPNPLKEHWISVSSHPFYLTVYSGIGIWFFHHLSKGTIWGAVGQSQQRWQQGDEEKRIPGSCSSLGVAVASPKSPSSPLEGGQGQVWDGIPQLFQSQGWHDQLWHFPALESCAGLRVAQLSQAGCSTLQEWRSNYTDIWKFKGNSEWRTVEELIQSLCQLKPGHLHNKFSEQSWNTTAVKIKPSPS